MEEIGECYRMHSDGSDQKTHPHSCCSPPGSGFHPGNLKIPFTCYASRAAVTLGGYEGTPGFSMQAVRCAELTAEEIKGRCALRCALLLPSFSTQLINGSGTAIAQLGSGRHAGRCSLLADAASCLRLWRTEPVNYHTRHAVRG